MTGWTPFGELLGVRVGMALLAGSRQSDKASPSKRRPPVAPSAFEGPVFANERKTGIRTMNVGHPSPRPAVLTMTFLARFLKLA